LSLAKDFSNKVCYVKEALWKTIGPYLLSHNSITFFMIIG